MNNTVLITGGLGYIGSHIYLSLLKKNYYPIIVDNLSTSDVTILKNSFKKGTGKVSSYHIFYYIYDLWEIFQ